MCIRDRSLEVVILEVDREKERVSLGLKQMTDNPWAEDVYKRQLSKK